MVRHLLLILLFTSTSVLARRTNALPSEVESVLAKSGKNRAELEKAITYFKKTNDALKLKAVYFLIQNMDVHYSANYYWADGKGNRIPYNELSYPNSTSANKAAEQLKAKHPGARMVPELVPDISTIKGDFLIDHVNKSFAAWKNSPIKSIQFKDFCEYILPYRVDVEPVQNWMMSYREKFRGIEQTIEEDGLQKALSELSTNVNTWFLDTYKMEKRTEPLPRLGAMQLLFRKEGPCEDIADLGTFILRSQGIPAVLDIIPMWATSTGGHFTTATFNANMSTFQFDLSTPGAARKELPSGMSLEREPAKVIRETYAKQPQTLASFEKPQNIPDGFMRTLNYKDVTPEYWKTTDVNCRLFPGNKSSKTAYAYVFNGLKWKAAWWGKVEKDAVTFKSMSKGAVYLPGYYKDGKLIPAGPPIAIGYNHELVLTPDLNKRIPVIVKQESGYINFKPGKKYKLYWWNNKWQLATQQTAGMNTTEMLFAGVPRNSLLLLVPEYSTGKERPFIILDNGTRNWF